ncbi:diguanylate cyclase [Oceanirhabdus seepicola]|uniref:Diguanylate cyclase n=1 Tax=Oceanirhabdus seepicola TaxID=2828781 RepID=A0A9J6P8M5_9CLOT|nr:diguanylate cyclase [Oceanirhabdus seepicola]MCM1991893.1 diguanylate cyclase [Oceanirhabdus seepicola]
MELINGRYRLIKVIEHKTNKTIYLADDVLKAQKVMLNIVKLEYIPKNFDIYDMDINEYLSINSKYIIKILDMGIVKSIDNRKVENISYYYYITEHEDTYKFDITHIKDFQQLKSGFIDICKGLSYLHLKGEIYKYLNPGDIIIYHDENNQLHAKIRDILSSKIDEYNILSVDNEKLEYKAPELINGEEINESIDIYSLGMIIKNTIIPNFNSDVKDLNEIKDKNNMVMKLFIIVRKMINKNQKKRYKSIEELVEQFNRIYNLEEKFYDVNDVEKINFKHKMYGRDLEIKEILEWYDKNENGVAFVHAPNGMGKTRFLNEIEYKLKLRSNEIYSSFLLESKENNNYIIFEEIIMKFFHETKKEIVKKYEEEFKLIIPEINSKKIQPISLFNDTNERYKFNSRLLNFIYDAIENKKAIIIIDNLQYASEYIIEILEMHLLKNNLDKNILFILSYSDEEIWLNKFAHGFITKFKDKNNNLNIPLTSLNLKDSTMLIKDMLSMSYLPNKFAKRIFNHTYGNPIFVQEVIKDLFAKKVMYIDESIGKWTIDFEDYDELDLPENIVIASMGQINDLNKDNYDFLKKLSVLKDDINIEIIKEAFNYSEADILYSIDSLCRKGLLSRNNQRYERQYYFTNKMMKDVIYGRLKDDEKKTYNNLIALIFEKKYLSGEKIDIRNMVNHFEKAQDYSKVKEYCSLLAENMININDNLLAIEYLEKAIRYSDNYDENDIRIMIKLALLNHQCGESERAIEILHEADEKAEGRNFIELRFEILNELTNLFNRSKNTSKCEELVEIMFELYSKTKYKKGYLYYLLNKTRIYAFQQGDLEEGSKILKEAKELASESEYRILGELYNIEGIINFLKSNTMMGIECFKQALKYYEKDNYIKGKIHCLNNIAVIYYEHFQDIQKGMEFFEKSREIAEEYRIIEILPLIFSNLAESNIDLNNLERGEIYLNKAIQILKGGNDKQSLLSTNVAFVSLNLKYGNLKIVENYYSECKEIIAKNGDYNRDKGEYYITAALRALFYLNLDYAKELCDKAEQVYGEEQNKALWRVYLTKNLIKFYRGEDVDKLLEDSFHIIDRIIYPTEKMNMLFELAVTLALIGYKNYLKSIFEKIIALKIDNMNINSLIKYEIARAYTEKDYDIEKLIGLMNEIKDTKMKLISLFGNYVIASIYYKKKNYIYALNYYLIAIDIFKEIYEYIPLKYKESFIDRKILHEVLAIIRELKIYFTRNNEDTNYEMRIEDQFKSMISFDFFKEIVNSKAFNEYTKKLYKHKELYYIEDIKDITRNLFSSPEENLKFICNFLENITLASRCMIIKSNSSEHKVIFSSNGDVQLPKDMNIIDRVKITRENITFNKLHGEKSRINVDGRMNGIICLPIEDSYHRDIININDRNRVKNKSSRIKGVLYIESYNILNNFNEHTVSKCLELMPLISSIMSSYEFKMISAIDKLTGVYTRKYLMDSFKLELEKTYEEGNELSVLIADLDHFKNINDKFGHQKGDEVLEEASRIMKNSIRTDDIIGRYGGEEFLIILPNTGANEAMKIAERIRINLMNSNIIGENYPVTVSIGLASYPEHSQLQEELIEKADKALYDAKEEGRNRVKIYTPLMEFGNKGANKLSGIITGNSVEDSRNVLTFIEVLDLVDEQIGSSNKIYKLLGRLIETTEAEDGTLFKVNDGRIAEVFSRRRYNESWIKKEDYNKEIVREVIENKKEMCTIDWNLRNRNNPLTGLPDWNSIICIPLIDHERVIAVLLLEVPTSEKEFNYENLNFVNVIIKLAKRIFCQPCDGKESDKN